MMYKFKIQNNYVENNLIIYTIINSQIIPYYIFVEIVFKNLKIFKLKCYFYIYTDHIINCLLLENVQ